jgi:hypothetical protein
MVWGERKSPAAGLKALGIIGAVAVGGNFASLDGISFRAES